MIKFFRKIRQNLLMENKNGKYFKYAIGEIILVVIGILIALSINNWNENRKLKSKSLDYLQRLRIDLENVSEDVNESVTDTDRKYHQALLTLEALETKKLLPTQREDFENYLKRYYQFQITVQNTVAYNEMLSSGDLGLIKNEWLRTSFSNLSDSRDFIIEVNQSNHNAYRNNMQLIEKHVRYHVQNIDTDSTKIKVAYDFDAMTNDDLLVNQISNQVYTWWDILRMYKRYQKEVNIVKDSILIELNRLN